MKKHEVGKADIAELLDAYRHAAADHGHATEKGDYKVANKEADLIAAIYVELRRRDAQTRLLTLLTDEAPGVRLWAASHALEFAPHDGERVLANLVSHGRLLGLSAETTLKEWRAGRLRFG